ncbi:MAG TPA: TolC family protein [Candidatus Binataceae bacterium]|nr:TolC family protein [Candidatus Binataceae bacterium]
MRFFHAVTIAVALFGFTPIARASDALTLDQCIARALATIPRLAQSFAEVSLVLAQRDETAASLNPSLRFDLQYLQEPGYREAITNRGVAAAQLIGDYLIYDGGRRQAQLRAAKYALDSSRFGLALARNEVVFDTTVAFFALIHASRSEQEMRASVERLQRYLSVLESLRQSGRATANDVLRMDLMLRDARVQLDSFSHDRTRAAFALGALIGDYGHGDINVATPPDISNVSANAQVDANPAVRALERDRASALAQLDAARDENYPTLSTELTAGFLGTDPPTAVTRYGGASYGGVLSVPIFQGGAIRARVDQAKAKVRQSYAALAQARIDIGERMAEARSRLDGARSSIAMLEQAVPIAESSFQLSWSRFLGGGTITVLEIVDSYNQSISRRLALIDRQFDASQAAAEISLLSASTSQ